MGTPRIDRFEKNILINGNFDYWQRGTLISTISSFGSDRWKGNSAQASQQRRDRTFSVGLPTGSLYGNQVTSLAGGNELFQRIESARLIPYAGKYVTFSIKAGLVSGTTPLIFNVRKPTVTDNYSASNIVLASPSFAAPSNHTGTYTTYKWTFQIDSDMAAKGFAVGIQGDATVWSIIFSQMMLTTTNDDGTDLVPASFIYAGQDELEELFLCQKYYEFGRLDYYVPGGGTGYSGSPVFYKVTKRATPVLTTLDGASNPNRISYISSGTGAQTPNNLFTTQINNERQHLLLLTTNPTSFGIVYNWTADAEL